MKQVIIYTDGACSGNPGPGGWGAILKYGAHERELSGGEPSTTNNRMELLGAITALQSLREPCQVTLYTDSQYLANAINLGWLRGWKQKGWRRKEGELKNADLWQTLDALLQTHKVQFVWVKGHADNVYNNRCDALAVRRGRKTRRASQTEHGTPESACSGWRSCCCRCRRTESCTLNGAGSRISCACIRT